MVKIIKPLRNFPYLLKKFLMKIISFIQIIQLVIHSKKIIILTDKCEKKLNPLNFIQKF